MLDLIIFLAVLAIFYGGFWCGARYRTVATLIATVKAEIASWFA